MTVSRPVRISKKPKDTHSILDSQIPRVDRIKPTTRTGTKTSLQENLTEVQMTASNEVLPPTNTPVDLHCHPNLPDFISEIYKRLDAHDNTFTQIQALLEENTQLKQDLIQTRKSLLQVEQDNHHLREQLTRLQSNTANNELQDKATDIDMGNDTQGTMASRYANPDYEPVPRVEPAMRPSFAAIVAKTPTQAPSRKKKTTTTKQRAAALRLFTVPSQAQGFQYVYLHTRSKVAPSQVRKNLQQAGIQQSRLLEIHYPDQNVIALLFHNEYVEEARNLLRKAVVLSDFNPISPSILRDPKHQDLSDADKLLTVQEIHHNRLLRALNRIRSPINLAVARSFLQQEWITQAQYDTFKHGGVMDKPQSEDEVMDDPLANFTTDNSNTIIEHIMNTESQAEGDKSAPHS